MLDAAIERAVAASSEVVAGQATVNAAGALNRPIRIDEG